MHEMWSHMFALGPSVAEKVLRPILIYAFLIISLRLSGKRELAQLNPFDLIVLLTLSNTVQNAIIGDDNTVTGGVIGAVSLLAVNYLVVRFMFRHQKWEELVEGRADVLVADGVVDHGRLTKEMITTAELEAAARKQGFESLSDVSRCVLEPGGTISFLARKPLTDEVRHQQMMDRLDRLTADVQRLAAARALDGPPSASQP